MSSQPTLTITTSSSPGTIIVTPSFVANPSTSNYPVIITAILSDVRSSTPMKLVNLPVKDPETDAYLTSFNLTSPDLTLGQRTYVVIRYTYGDGSVINSQPAVAVVLKDKPIDPRSNVVAIRSADKGLELNIGASYAFKSVSDGFDPITKATVFISQVDDEATNSVNFWTIDVPITGSAIGYNTWYPVLYENNAEFLSNSTLYEVSFLVQNSLGSSNLSETYPLIPRDTPNQILNVLARSLLAEQRAEGFEPNDPRGDTLVYFTASPDAVQLIAANRRVLKYKLYEQEVDSLGNDVGLPVVTEIVLNNDNTSPNDINRVIDGVNYRYRVLIQGSPSRLGKLFKYYVLGNNINGDGPQSLPTSLVNCLASPASPVFTLKPRTVTTNSGGTPLTTYTGNWEVTVTGAPAPNGGNLVSTPFLIPAVNSGPIRTYNYITYDLKIDDVTSSDPEEHTSVGSTYVDAIQDFTTSSSTSGGVTTTTATLGNKYNISLDVANILVTLELKNKYSLIQPVGAFVSANEILTRSYGRKFKFALRTLTQDKTLVNPQLSSAFTSQATIDTKTSFASPVRVNNAVVYALDTDGTPSKLNNNSALRFVFTRLTNSQMNGMDTFNAPKKYILHRDSLPVIGVDPILHDLNSNVNELEFRTNVDVGTLANLYIRTSFVNPEFLDELGNPLEISGQETSPPRTGSAVDYPLAVTNLAVAHLTPTSFRVNWTKQPNNPTSLQGHSTSSIFNRVFIASQNSPTAIASADIEWSAADQSFTVTGLNAGDTFKVAVVACARYQQGPQFPDPYTIGKNNASTVVVSASTPGPVTFIEHFGEDRSIRTLFDAPSVTGGILSSLFKYRVFVSRNDDTSDVLPGSWPRVNNVLIPEAIEVSTPSIAVSTRAFNVTTNSFSDILQDKEHKVAVMAYAVVGGQTIPNRNITSVLGGNIVINGVQNSITQPLSIQTSATSVVRTIEGDIASPLLVVTGPSPPLPIPDGLAGDQKVTISVRKIASGGVTDMVIIVDNNDSGVGMFDTRGITYNGFSGLFGLEQAAQAGALNGPLSAFGPSGFNFRTQTSGGVTSYLIDFIGLQNARFYNFSISNVRFVSPNYIFSAASVITRAPEAPPTSVTNISFLVGRDTSISNPAIAGFLRVFFSEPGNVGGALINGNSQLKFSVSLLDSSNNILNTIETETNNVIFTGLQIYSSPTFTQYKATVAAFYTKVDQSRVVGPVSNVNTLPNNVNNLIRIATAPTPIPTTVVAGNNALTVNLTSRVTEQSSNYPITAIRILVFPTSISGAGFSRELVVNSNVIGSRSEVFNGLPNGVDYTVEVTAVEQYGWAQQVPVNRVVNNIPFGPLSVTGITPVPTILGVSTGGRVFDVDINRNGSGDVVTVIVIAKVQNSTVIITKPLSGANLPSVSNIGDQTSLIAAGQLGKFTVDLRNDTNSPVTDILVIVSTPLGVDGFTLPVNSSVFGFNA